ncbi:MAG: dihydroorotate dehydrogenase electron transfer subunit [Acidobacteriota bacterium]
MIYEFEAEIIEKKIWSNKYCCLSLKIPFDKIELKPGQFFMVKVQENFPLLRRPLAVMDFEESSLKFFFQRVGIGTEILFFKKVGERVRILGPFGNGFSYPEEKKKSVLLIAGGRGISPIFYLAKKMYEHRIPFVLIYGGKAKEDIPLMEELEENSFNVVYVTEDGSFGKKGMVIDFIEEIVKKKQISSIYSCGPVEMLKKVSYFSERIDIESLISLEIIMGCGFGACWGCAVRIRENGKECFKKACVDGPVFKSEEIVW